MKKALPLILLLVGVVFIITGFNGSLGTFLASIFTPNRVLMNEEAYNDTTKEEMEKEVATKDTLEEKAGVIAGSVIQGAF